MYVPGVVEKGRRAGCGVEVGRDEGTERARAEGRDWESKRERDDAVMRGKSVALEITGLNMVGARRVFAGDEG